MLELIQTGLGYVVAFLFVFSLVVFIHEMGHFTAARLFGVKVDAFSIGFGRTLVSWTDRLGTVWRVAAVPLGGYVKFFGDASAASNPDADELKEIRRRITEEHGPEAIASVFHFKPVWQRAIVVAAGPIANFILATTIFSLVLLIFGEQHMRARVGEVTPDSPAAAAGFQPGDLVVAGGGREIHYFSDLQEVVMLRAGNAETFTVERDGGTRRLDVTIGRRTVEDMFGRDVALGFLGITSSSDPADEITVRYGPIAAVGRGAERTWRVVETTGRYMGRMVTGRESADQLGGPLRIAAMSGRTAERSFASAGPDDDLGGRITRTMVALFTLAALLSIGIGLVNLLPIPVLDGGHLVYYAYEAAAGRPLGEGAQEWGFRIGLAFVLGLMLFVTWNDIRYLRVFEALGNLLS